MTETLGIICVALIVGHLAQYLDEDTPERVKNICNKYVVMAFLIAFGLSTQ